MSSASRRCRPRCPTCATASSAARSQSSPSLHGSALGGGLEIAHGGALPRRIGRREARPAGSHAGIDPGRRRYATRAAPDGRGCRPRIDAGRATASTRTGRWRSDWSTAWTPRPNRWPPAWRSRTRSSHRAHRCAVPAMRASSWTTLRPAAPRSTLRGQRPPKGERPVLAAQDHRSRRGDAGPAVRRGPAARARALRACLDSPQRQGLVHAFFAEREVAKAPETRAAQAATDRKRRHRRRRNDGRRHRRRDARCGPAGDDDRARCAEPRARARARREGLRRTRRQGPTERRSEGRDDGTLHRLDRRTMRWRDVDLVVEAVFEDMAVKKAVFARARPRMQARRGAGDEHVRTSTSTRSRPASRGHPTSSACTSSRRRTS